MRKAYVASVLTAAVVIASASLALLRSTPVSAHCFSVAICCSDREFASRYFAWAGLALQGGIVRFPVTSAICFARRFASAYVSSVKGAAPFGRWQEAQ